MAEQGSRKRSVAAKTPFVEPARAYGPRGIAALLAPVLRPVLRRRGTTLASLIEDWTGIVGPDLAARSLPVKYAAGTLTIGCSGPDSLEFQHSAPMLIGRINLALGGQPITRLRFTDLVVPLLPSVPAVVQSALTPQTPPPLDGPLGEALARLRNGLERTRTLRRR